MELPEPFALAAFFVVFRSLTNVDSRYAGANRAWGDRADRGRDAGGRDRPTTETVAPTPPRALAAGPRGPDADSRGQPRGGEPGRRGHPRHGAGSSADRMAQRRLPQVRDVPNGASSVSRATVVFLMAPGRVDRRSRTPSATEVRRLVTKSARPAAPISRATRRAGSAGSPGRRRAPPRGSARPRGTPGAPGTAPGGRDGRRRGNQTARRPGSAGTPSRTAPAAGTRPGARPRARSANGSGSISAAFCIRTRVRWSRNVVSPISAYARCSWRRDDATRRAMSSSERSEANSRSTISAASWNSEVRRRMVEARCVGTYLGTQ